MKKYKNLYKKAKARISELESQLHHERAEKEYATQQASEYKKRFQEFGSNVKTIGAKDGKLLTVLEWEMKPEPYGTWAYYSDKVPFPPDWIKGKLVQNIAKGLIENDLVQFIFHSKDEEGPFGGPFFEQNTIGAKLFVIPWDQVPHERTVKLKKYVENSLAFMEGKDDGKR